jgi:hypothetical protein
MSPTTGQPTEVLLIADRTDQSSAVIQDGQPPAQMGAWLIPVAKGEDPVAVAETFATSAGMSAGMLCRVIVDPDFQSFDLATKLVPHEDPAPS